MFDKLKGAAGAVTSKATSLKDMGVEAVQATVAELNVTLPQLAEVGYSVSEVSLEIGLSPKIVVSLNKVFDVDPAAFAAVLAANKERKAFCTILSALQTANQWQGKIQFRNRHFRKVEIELAIPPAIRMYFQEGHPEEPHGVAVQLRAEPAPPLSPPPAPLLPVESEEPPPEPEPTSEPEAPALEVAPPEPPPEPEPILDRVEDLPPPEPVAETPQWLRMWCEGCQKAYRVPGEMAGRKAKCRRCGTWIIVENVPEE